MSARLSAVLRVSCTAEQIRNVEGGACAWLRSAALGPSRLSAASRQCAALFAGSNLEMKGALISAEGLDGRVRVLPSLPMRGAGNCPPWTVGGPSFRRSSFTMLCPTAAFSAIHRSLFCDHSSSLPSDS